MRINWDEKGKKHKEEKGEHCSTKNSNLHFCFSMSMWHWPSYNNFEFVLIVHWLNHYSSRWETEREDEVEMMSNDGERDELDLDGLMLTFVNIWLDGIEHRECSNQIDPALVSLQKPNVRRPVYNLGREGGSLSSVFIEKQFVLTWCFIETNDQFFLSLLLLLLFAFRRRQDL